MSEDRYSGFRIGIRVNTNHKVIKQSYTIFIPYRVILLQLIGKSKVSKMRPKPNITYPFIRLPQDCGNVIGQTVTIYETEHEGKRAFLLMMSDNATLSSRVIQPNATKNIESRVCALEMSIREISDKINLKEPDNPSEIKFRNTPDQIRTGVAGSKVLHD